MSRVTGAITGIEGASIQEGLRLSDVLRGRRRLLLLAVAAEESLELRKPDIMVIQSSEYVTEADHVVLEALHDGAVVLHQGVDMSTVTSLACHCRSGGVRVARH